MPAQAAPQRQGLLGGFFGPEGRDARARLAIGLEGLTMNPNQALIGQLQQGIEDRKIEGERNRTLEWLSTLNTPEAQRALQYAQATGDIVGAAKMVLTPATQERGVVVGNDIVDRITGNVIYKGPEREELTPAAFVALDLQARAAGFEPGTPEYKEFMATRGAGLAAEARAIGTVRGEATAAAPVDVATADTTLQLIADLRADPGLEIATGASSVFNIAPGTPGYDFQNRVNQLLSGGFLTAIDQLRGMGSLSNAEGQTATRAISRMDTATSTPAFLDALADYEAIVRVGRERAAARLQAPAAGTAAPDTGTTTRLRFNEETGEFE
jgi:hypothetical protein